MQITLKWFLEKKYKRKQTNGVKQEPENLDKVHKSLTNKKVDFFKFIENN